MSESISNWEGIDLNEIIVDYHEIDDMWAENIDDIFNPDDLAEDTFENPTMIASDNDIASTSRSFVGSAYECPVCLKSLRSVSGFRGHVMKQHPTFNRVGFKGRLLLLLSMSMLSMFACL